MRDSYRAETLTTHAALDHLMPDWCALYCRAGCPGVFAHPDWLRAWARHFVRDGDLWVVAVRSPDNTLMGVLPLYRTRPRVAGRVLCVALRPLGDGADRGLTEVTRPLTDPRAAEAILSAAIAHLFADGRQWDWLDLTLPPDLGWLSPHLIPDGALAAGASIVSRGVRAAVLLPLAATWDETRGGLSRNIKESLRRGRNRLAREERAMTLRVPAVAGALDALAEIARLHAARSVVPGKERHGDVLSDPRVFAFLRDAVAALAPQGFALPTLLDVDGVPAAGRLVLRAGGEAFLSISGFDPAFWTYGVATTLVGEIAAHAIASGDRTLNFSFGPDASKLRWSRALALHLDFSIVHYRRASRLLFTAITQVRANRYVQREYGRHSRST